MVKTTSSPSSPSAADSMEDLVFLDHQEANEFSYWEFINQSDADSDTDSLHSVENGFVSWYSFTAPPRPRSSNSDEGIETEPVLDGRDVVDAANFIVTRVEIDDDFNDDEEEIDGEDEEEEEEMDDDDVGYGLDDELVPWNLAGKFGRQRMRKLGKRVCSKMVNSKRDPYAYVKRGCVHGKYELEMKA